MSDLSDGDVDRLTDRIRIDIPEPWPDWPGGWPNAIEAALIDAVFSARARYGDQHTGVRAVVRRWNDNARGGSESPDDLRELAAYVDRGDDLASLLGNRQQVPGGATTKGEAVALAARNLVDVGVVHAAQLDTKSDEQRRAYTRVRGLGDVTWEYFGMLLGCPGVKADVMLRRFVEGALGRTIESAECSALVKAAAARLERNQVNLDHAIWRHQRGLKR